MLLSLAESAIMTRQSAAKPRRQDARVKAMSSDWRRTEAAESIAAAVSRSRSTNGRRKLSTDALPSAPPLGPLAPLLHSPTPARDEAERCAQTVWRVHLGGERTVARGRLGRPPFLGLGFGEVLHQYRVGVEERVAKEPRRRRSAGALRPTELHW